MTISQVLDCWVAGKPLMWELQEKWYMSKRRAEVCYEMARRLAHDATAATQP